MTDSEVANFTCAINCTKGVSLRWQLAAPELGVVNNPFYNTKVLKFVWKRRYGITITSQSHSASGHDVTISILTTSQLNGTVVQCEAYATRVSNDSYYSKFALLQVMKQPDPEPVLVLDENPTNCTTNSTATTVAPSPATKPPPPV